MYVIEYKVKNPTEAWRWLQYNTCATLRMADLQAQDLALCVEKVRVRGTGAEADLIFLEVGYA